MVDLFEYMMMHGLTDPKFPGVSVLRNWRKRERERKKKKRKNHEKTNRIRGLEA